MKNAGLALGVIAATIVFSSVASAEQLLAYATRVGNALGSTTGVAVALDSSGASSLQFFTSTANQLVKITYNAECSVSGPVESWISVRVLVDGTEANPQSGTSFGFCTATVANTFTWTGAVRQSLITVPTPGAHNVQIIVDLNAGANTWELGDSSLVVE